MQISPESQASIQQSFARIRLRFVARLQARIDELDDLMVALEMSPENPAPLTAAREIAHATLGVAATLGFPRLGELAAEAERRLVSANTMEPDAKKLQDVFVAVERMVVEMDDIYRAGMARVRH